MLRLRPSELTLTPDDVDETFRRIALRQTPQAPQHWTMRPLGHPGRPILRRGPQRFTQDAITIPRNIRILQPQQAIFTSVDEDDVVSDQEATEAPLDGNSRHERNNATVGSPAAVPSHLIQIPLRPRSEPQMLSAQTTSNGQGEEGTSHTPRNPLSGPARSGSTRNVENGNQQPAQLPPVDSSANTPELRGGGSLATLARAHGVARDAVYAPSPMNQIQRFTSPARQTSLGDPTKPQSSPSTDHGTLHLNKCSAQTPHSPRCRYRKYLPSSEPRRASGRHPAVTRSRSSGDAPSVSFTCQSTSSLEEAPKDDVFVTSTTTQPSSRHCRGLLELFSEGDGASGTRSLSSTLEGLRPSEQASLRRKEGGSGATSVGSAYSWYGSLGSDTQFPGSEHSQSDDSCAQLGGVRAKAHRLSPLPSMPYTRTIQNDLTTSSPPPSGHLRQGSGGYVTATTAVTHDLQSPLDPYVEHYQRWQQAPHALLNFPMHASPSMPSVGGLPMGRSSPDGDMQSDNQARFGSSLDHGVSHQQRSPEYHGPSSRTSSRMSEYARVEQRLGENAPVSAPANQSNATRRGQVQTQRAVYERLQNPTHATYSRVAGGIAMIPTRRNVSQRNLRHDIFNRARNYTPHDSTTTGMPRQPSQGQAPHAVFTDPSRPSPIQVSGQHRTGFAGHTRPRVHHGGSEGLRVQPRRDGRLSALASFEQGSGTTSRHGHSPLTRAAPTTTGRTYRRIGAEQRDQENAGDGLLMRREEANVAARYGEEEQLRMLMNETPPGIGRVERRMME